MKRKANDSESTRFSIRDNDFVLRDMITEYQELTGLLNVPLAFRKLLLIGLQQERKKSKKLDQFVKKLEEDVEFKLKTIRRRERTKKLEDIYSLHNIKQHINKMLYEGVPINDIRRFIIKATKEEQLDAPKGEKQKFILFRNACTLTYLNEWKDTIQELKILGVQQQAIKRFGLEEAQKLLYRRDRMAWSEIRKNNRLLSTESKEL